MARLTDPQLLTCYQNALRNWRFNGFIVFEKEAVEGLRQHLSNYTEKALKELLFDFVVTNGGEVDQVAETRENWRDKWDHHYDLRPVIGGIKFYVETRLDYKDPTDPDDPLILIVNIHPA
jgi:hypothetical protein